MLRSIAGFPCIILLTISCIAQTVVDNGETDSALTSTDQLRSTEVSNRPVDLVEARIAIARLRVPRKVRQLYEKAVKAFQKHKAADAQRKLNDALTLADLYNEQLHFDESVVVSKRAVALSPGAWPVHYEMARAFIGQHRYDLALSSGEAGLRTKHHGTLLHLAKAHALKGLKKYQQAAAKIETYLRYQPHGEGSLNAHDLLLEVERRNGRMR